MRFVSLFLTLMLLCFSSYAYELDYYSKFGHTDNYGNLDLRNKPYTQLPSGLVVKGNLNISQTPPIKKLPKGA
ncbi:leucine-rich repeat protein [Vibrio sp. JCM 18905]|nr:leucine-rich repeat protein [Vibrio sp. JCM 18905]